MKANRNNQALVKKLAFVGLLTALAVVLSYIKIPLFGTVTVTLVLPVVVVGAALYGPVVGAWLTVIPNISAFSEAGIFMVYQPIGCIFTLLLKGILAGLAAGFVYKLLSKKHPIGAVTCSAVVTPIVNTGIFVAGCYIFIWEEILEAAASSGVGIGILLLGLAGINFVAELILNLILCPTILRIIHIGSKK
ncbi:MAG: ECF transporter S component [Clostridia bacterium]|nr:ECF transporter S component [Clostridia bacterium]